MATPSKRPTISREEQWELNRQRDDLQKMLRAVLHETIGRRDPKREAVGRRVVAAISDAYEEVIEPQD
jgi:hypothetical protein